MTFDRTSLVLIGQAGVWEGPLHHGSPVNFDLIYVQTGEVVMCLAVLSSACLVPACFAIFLESSKIKKSEHKSMYRLNENYREYVITKLNILVYATISQ